MFYIFNMQFLCQWLKRANMGGCSTLNLIMVSGSGHIIFNTEQSFRDLGCKLLIERIQISILLIYNMVIIFLMKMKLKAYQIDKRFDNILMIPYFYFLFSFFFSNLKYLFPSCFISLLLKRELIMVLAKYLSD